MKLVLNLIFLLPLIYCCNSITKISPYNTFKNGAFNYSVEIKGEWKQKVNKGDGFYIIVWNLPPIKSKYNDKLVSPHVGVEASKNWETFNEAFNNSNNEIKKVAYNYTFDKKKNSIVFQYGDRKKQLKGKCYYYFKKGVLYRITFSANKDSYDYYLSEFEQFSKSFTITN